MVLSRLTQIANRNLIKSALYNTNIQTKRNKPFYRSGALKPMPEVIPFGLIGIFGTVALGLFVGAAISKNIANFLEENELFVPSDDDDDDY